MHQRVAALPEAVSDDDVIVGRKRDAEVAHRAASCCSIQPISFDFRAQITLPMRNVGIRTLASLA